MFSAILSSDSEVRNKSENSEDPHRTKPSDAEQIRDRGEGGRKGPANPASGSIPQAFATARNLPDQLERIRLDLESRLLQEHRPQYTLAKILLSEVARDSAALEVAQQNEIAALKVGMRSAQKIAEATMAIGSDRREALEEDFVVAAFSNEFSEKAARSRRHRQASLFRSLALLQNFTEKFVKSSVKMTAEDFRRHFSDAETCERYLRVRHEKSEWRCPKCDSRSRQHWISTRHCWECSQCRGQFGLRYGTVMADSPLSFDKWFLAIGTVCIDHSTTAPQIADGLGIVRMATARRMLAAILNAIQSPDREQLLVGLPTYIELGAVSPESSGAFSMKSQTEKPLAMAGCEPTDEIRSSV